MSKTDAVGAQVQRVVSPAVGDYVLATPGMALDEFKVSGTGKDCGRDDCGAAND